MIGVLLAYNSVSVDLEKSTSKISVYLAIFFTFLQNKDKMCLNHWIIDA